MNPSSRIKRNNARFMFECGILTVSWCDITALRIRVNMSDMGSVTGIFGSVWIYLPGEFQCLQAGFTDAGKIPKQGLFAEDYSAHSEESDISPRAPGCEAPVSLSDVA